MTAPDVDAIRARYGDWYGSDDDDTERGADWSLRDDGETLSHCIVREDIPALLDEVERLRAERDRAEATIARVQAEADSWDGVIAIERHDLHDWTARLIADAQSDLRAAIEGTDS